jgi:hypothetical protein
MTRLYLAGPMTGLPEFNYPAFHAEAARLRALGFEVENPAENPLPADAPWHICMRAAVRQLVTCDQIATLPGWANSPGAQLEVYIGQRLGIDASHASNFTDSKVFECSSL